MLNSLYPKSLKFNAPGFVFFFSGHFSAFAFRFYLVSLVSEFLYPEHALMVFFATKFNLGSFRKDDSDRNGDTNKQYVR